MIGFGTIKLTVNIDPYNPDEGQDVILRNALHCPDSICNIIGCPIWEKHRDMALPFTTDADLQDIRDAANHYMSGEGDPPCHIQIDTDSFGYNLGPSVDIPDMLYYLQFRFPDAEMERLNSSKPSNPRDLPTLSSSQIAWLERYFLREHGLEKDQEKGRVVLGALMFSESRKRAHSAIDLDS